MSSDEEDLSAEPQKLQPKQASWYDVTDDDDFWKLPKNNYIKKDH